MRWSLGRGSRGGGEIVLVRVAERFGPALDLELAVDVAQVKLHRLLAQPERRCDLLVRVAVAELDEHRHFLFGQACRTRAPRDADMGGDGAVDYALVDDLADRRRQ